MKKRSLVKMFLLFIVTLGIYRLYWVYKTRQELVAHGQKPPRFIWLLAIYVVTIVSLMSFVGFSLADAYSYNQRIDDCIANQTRPTEAECEAYVEDYEGSNAVYSIGVLVSTIVFYVVLLLGGPLMAVWYWKYAKAAEVVTKGKLQFAMCMIVLLLIPDGFDMLIVQDVYNNVPTKTTTGHLPPTHQSATV